MAQTNIVGSGWFLLLGAAAQAFGRPSKLTCFVRESLSGGPLPNPPGLYNPPVETEARKLHIKLFGPMTVSEPGCPPVRVASKKLAALLGALASNPGTAMRRETLAAMIWPELDSTSARRNLRQQVFILKQFLEQFSCDALVADEETLCFRADACETDFQAFAQGASSEDEASWEAAVTARTGYFLEELDDPETEHRRHELDDDYTMLLFKLIKLRYSQGRHIEAIAYAKLAKHGDPLGERASFALVRLYSATRQFAAAKTEYEELELRLSAEIGTQPSVALKDLIRKSANNPASLDFDDLPIPGVSPDSIPRMRASHRFGLAVAAIMVLFALGFAYVRSSRPSPTYEELETQFVAIASEEVTTSSRSRQAELLTTIAELAWKDAYGKQENYWQIELTPHMQEIDEVMEWCTTNQPSVALRIGGALERYFLLVNKERDWGVPLGKALDRAPVEQSAMYARALYTWAIAQPAASPKLIEKRLALAQAIYKELGDRAGEAQVIRVRGFCRASAFHPVEARNDYEQALKLNREIGSETGVALCNFCLAVMGRDPRESIDADLLRRAQHALVAYGGFAKIGNVWGIRSSANLLASHGLMLPAREDTFPVLKDCRSKLLDAAEFEQSLSNMNGPLQDVSKAALISFKIGDNAETSRLLIRIIREGFGSSLPIRDRYLLSVACALLSHDTYVREFGDVDPYDVTGQIASQQGKAAAAEAKRLAKSLTASQIINRVLK